MSWNIVCTQMGYGTGCGNNRNGDYRKYARTQDVNMLGYSHAVSGLVAAGVLATTLPQVIPDTPISYGLACVVGAGAALLPDADHPNARAAKTFGGVTRLVGAVSGGHRHGTHTIWAAILVGLACWFSSRWQTSIFGHMVTPLAGFIVFVTVTLGLAVLTGWRRLIILPLGLIVGAAAAFHTPSPAWLTVIVTTGYLVHILGDIITTKGVMVLRPLPPTVRLPVLGDAGSGREQILTSVLTLVFVLLTINLYHPLLP